VNSDKTNSNRAVGGNAGTGKASSSTAVSNTVNSGKSSGSKAIGIKSSSGNTSSASEGKRGAVGGLRAGSAGNTSTGRRKRDDTRVRSTGADASNKGNGRRKRDKLQGSSPHGDAKASHPANPTIQSSAPASVVKGVKEVESKEDLALARDIKEALRQNKFKLVYQPIMSVHDDDLDNYEVFLCLKHGQKMLLQEQFLPQAEKYGLMAAVDRWTVANAMAKLNEEEEQRIEAARKSLVRPRRVRFFINISCCSLLEKAALSRLIKTMVIARVAPVRIVLDVDKRILASPELTRILIRNVKRLKMEFVLNQYTEADNSISFLPSISVDYLKLSSDLTHNVEKDKEKQTAVNAIIRRAQQNGIKTMACAVENIATMSYLYQAGIDYLQGDALAEQTTILKQQVFEDMM
jgi:EAL domain-containing protein (putative c-di-GMP-specific phosphodiesterase class I)